MTAGALIMLILGLLLTWGGAGVCVAIAVRNRHL